MNSIIAGIRSKLTGHLLLSAGLACLYAAATITNVMREDPNQTFNSVLIGAGVVVVAYCVLVAYVQVKYGARRRRTK